ncbi:MAG: hypothetical protein QOJ75_2190, partial [Chloroflexota bacterium]|nr:hypothetical protein [Chloroflexota bacterium]
MCGSPFGNMASTAGLARLIVPSAAQTTSASPTARMAAFSSA